MKHVKTRAIKQDNYYVSLSPSVFQLFKKHLYVSYMCAVSKTAVKPKIT